MNVTAEVEHRRIQEEFSVRFMIVNSFEPGLRGCLPASVSVKSGIFSHL